jgi:hypothetical protein
VTDADGIRVAGTVALGPDIVSITVNSMPAQSLEGTFARWRTTADVPLVDGRNDLTIVATQRRGASFSLTGTVWKMDESQLADLIPDTAVPDQVTGAELASLARNSLRDSWLVYTPQMISTLTSPGFWSQTPVDDPGTDNDVSVVVDANGTVYTGAFSTTIGEPSLNVTAYDANGERFIWGTRDRDPFLFRFAVDLDRSRILAVRKTPTVALFAEPLSNPDGGILPPAETVLSDATHGTGPIPEPGSAVIVRDANHVYLPGCNGAMDVDLTTGNRATWGTNDRSCVIAEGQYQGKAIALARVSETNDAGRAGVARWQVRSIDPSAKVVTPLFEIQPNGTLQSAAVDASDGRLGVVMTSPFSLQAYDFSDGHAAPITFGAGPTLVQNRNYPVSTFTTPDGLLFLMEPGLLVDPDTGVTTSAQFPALIEGTEAWDPVAGALYVSATEGVYQVNPENGSSRRVGDALGYGAVAYDASSHSLYGLGSQTMDTATGATRPGLSSANLTNINGCGIETARVSPDGKSIRITSYPTAPGPVGNGSICGCMDYDIATGAVTRLENSQAPTSFCAAIFAPDGRLFQMNADELDVVDPATRVATPFSRAPDHGRGFPLPNLNQLGNYSIAPDPRRDRLWLTLIANEFTPGIPDYYFVIDPFNGDRVLVSD